MKETSELVTETKDQILNKISDILIEKLNKDEFDILTGGNDYIINILINEILIKIKLESFSNVGIKMILVIGKKEITLPANKKDAVGNLCLSKIKILNDKQEEYNNKLELEELTEILDKIK